LSPGGMVGWPCLEIIDLADALGVGVDVTGVEAP
jgi:hypothetical protein